MSIATTSTYNPTAQTIIDLALTDIGVLGQSGGGNPDPNIRPHALALLNLLLKRMDAEGVILIDVTRRTQTMTSGTASYTISNDVADLDEPARYTASGATYGSQVWSMTRDEYMALPDRTIQGTPYRYFAEKGFDANGIQQITLTLFPVPPNTGDSLEYAAVIRMHDITSISQNLGVQQKWLHMIRLGLAAALAIPYGSGQTSVAQLQKLYEDEKAIVLGDDNERGGLQLVPWGNTWGPGAVSGRYY